MSVLRVVIFFRLVLIPFRVSAENLNNITSITTIGNSDFTTVGDSKILLVEEKKSFADAETYCKDLDAQLIEFLGEEDWKQVCMMDTYHGS